MKMKKLLALALSAVMAVSMLAACGDGLRGGDVNLNKVNSILADDYGMDVKAQNSNDLNVALIEVAHKLKKDGPITSDNANVLLSQSRNYPLVNGTFVRLGGAGIATNAEIEAYGGLDEMAATLVVALSVAAGQQYGVSMDAIDFYVSAQKVNDTYWLVAAEVRIDLAGLLA